MARLYSNENFPLSVVEELRRLGHDVLTVLEAGKDEQAGLHFRRASAGARISGYRAALERATFPGAGRYSSVERPM